MVKVGVQSGGWYKEEDPLASLSYIKNCGFEAIDYNIDGFLRPATLAKQEDENYTSFFDKSEEELFAYYAPLKKAMKETGVSIEQMHAPFPAVIDGKDKLNEYTLEAIRKSIAVAAYLGCPAVVVHPTYCEMPQEEYEFHLDFYRKLMPDAKKHGVKVCLENIFWHRNARMLEGRISDAEAAVAIIDKLNEEAGTDAFGFCLDVGHAILTRKNIKRFITTLGKRLTLLHIHDNNGNLDLHMIPYSYLSTSENTVCDWDGFIAGLKEIGFDGVLAFETFRALNAFPPQVHEEVLKLISAIGRFWSEELSK